MAYETRLQNEILAGSQKCTHLAIADDKYALVQCHAGNVYCTQKAWAPTVAVLAFSWAIVFLHTLCALL